MDEDPIDSRQMQIFIALAEGGGLRQAAKRVGITESAISHALRNLEDNLEIKLFKRSGKCLQLTEQGRIFQAEAKIILSKMYRLRSSLARNTLESDGEVRLACATSFIQFVMPDVSREFSRCFPQNTLRVVPSDRDSCLSLLDSGDVSAAVLVNLPQDSTKYQASHLFDDDLHVLMSVDHELASLPKIPIHKLIKENIYLQNHNNFTSRLILGEIERWSFAPKKIAYIGNSEAIRELVKMNLGLSLQPMWAFRDSFDTDQYLWKPLEELNLNRSWHFAWSQEALPDIRVRTLLRLCQTAAKGLEKDRKVSLKA